jgi:1-acyl-sn-glycerol-3-phosphate acyltransferase
MNPCLEILKIYPRLYLCMFGLRSAPGGNHPLPNGPKIIAANHPNATDPFFLPFVLADTPHFLMRSRAFEKPILGWLLCHAGQIEVKPQDGKAAFAQAAETLRHGETVVLFPEGRFSREIPDGRLKSGAVRLSLATGVPIIPLGIHVSSANLTDMRSRWSGKFSLGLWQTSGSCHLRFGEEWHPEYVNRPNVRALTEELSLRIRRLVEEARKESQNEK